MGLERSNNKKLLTVVIDKNLSFDIHTKSICKKAKQKLSFLARLSNYLTNAHKFLFVNLVIKSHSLASKTSSNSALQFLQFYFLFHSFSKAATVGVLKKDLVYFTTRVPDMSDTNNTSATRMKF